MTDLPELCYFRPRDLQEALSALARPNACVYAGGTDLLIALAARRSWPGRVRELVDIKGISEADGITDLGDSLRIGALVTAAELASNALVRRGAPMLAQAATLTSAPALRRRGTVGGNIVTPHPAGDVATALLALDATVELVDEHGPRSVALNELVAPSRRNPPRRRVMLAVRVRKRRRSAFEKLALRAGFGRSIVAVGVSIGDGDVRVGLGGMHARPFRAVRTAEAIARGERIDDALASECRPPADASVSSAYRMKLADVLIERALANLRQR